MKHKLSNIVLETPAYMSDYADVYYHVNGEAKYDNELGLLFFGGQIDFMSYFNSCSLAKWKQYTQLKDFFLSLELMGDSCDIQFFGMSAGDDTICPLGEATAIALNGLDSADSIVADIQLPETDKALVGFMLVSSGVTAIKQGYYYADVAETDVNEVRLAVSTTTFKKEEYIVPNIELVKAQVLDCDDPIAGNFHMFVVDNGQTLDAEGLSSDGVTVLPNKNTGGAGGFARGMMEAIAGNYTHVLLMDDDVKMSTESFKRTFNLLRLAKGEYKNAFINGAMLSIEKPNMQFEDVSYVLKSGAYHRIKGDVDTSDIKQVLVSETTNVEVPNAYGAWWFSCIPVEAVKKNGLPLPLFVRCDDVEFGMRNQPTYMTMNGICVWHEAFAGRFRASVDCYQYARNFLIMIAMDDCANEDMFIARLERNVRLFLRSMAYDTAELLIDGVEDYLKGPEFLKTASGEQLMKTNGAKNEKLVPLDQLQGIDPAKVSYRPNVLIPDSDPKPVAMALKLFRTIPYDKHFLPDVLLHDNPAVIYYGGAVSFNPKTAGTKTLIAMDAPNGNAIVRTMDRQRWKSILNRWKQVKKQHAQSGEAVRQAYKAQKAYFTSEDFWKEYLGL